MRLFYFFTAVIVGVVALSLLDHYEVDSIWYFMAGFFIATFYHSANQEYRRRKGW